MVVFLTSSPTGDLDGKYICVGFDTRNGFADEVRKVWRKNARVLMISAFPDNRSANEEMHQFFHDAVVKTGLSCQSFDLWDNRVLEREENYTRDKVQSYDVIILGGGHVPTQQAFFRKLKLRERIAGFTGIVIGISAGTMNCADVVYAQPEEHGEATDPNYQRFIQGLGLTNLNVLPHYQLTKYSVKENGLRLIEDISLPDSVGHRFFSLPDGSYIIDWNDRTLIGDGSWIEPKEAKVYGEAYLLQDGKMSRYCEDNSSSIISSSSSCI